MNSQIVRHTYSEFLGTFALVFVGSGAIMTASSTTGGSILDIAVAHGLVLSIMCTAFMPIAAHFNPAVTIGFLFTRRITPMMAGVHIVAQVIGAVLAAFALKALFPEPVFALTHGGGQQINPDLSGIHAWLLESIATFFFMTAIYGTAVDKRTPRIGGFGIGLMLACVILTIGPLTGGSVNPARTFGPMVAHGSFEAFAIYLTAPIVGAVLAALAYENLILKTDPDASS
jgi:MIP family channel proteins